jgi:hypothetical protein
VHGNKFDAVQRRRFEGFGQCWFAVLRTVDADNNGTASQRFVRGWQFSDHGNRTPRM